MNRSILSLRNHVLVIVLIKILVIAGIRVLYFPSLKDQHLPADVYRSVQTLPSPASVPPASEESL